MTSEQEQSRSRDISRAKAIRTLKDVFESMTLEECPVKEEILKEIEEKTGF